MHVEREGEVEVSNQKLAHREVEGYIYMLFSRELIQKPSPENMDEEKFGGAEDTAFTPRTSAVEVCHRIAASRPN